MYIYNVNKTRTITLYNMSDIKKELKELEEIMHSTDEDREQKFEKKFLYIREHYASEEDNEAIYNFTLNGYKQINNELENMTRYLELQNQIKSVKEIIPVSYIARNYFGKSAAWLQQRLYGYKVRGKIYTLNEKDIKTLNLALQDISKKIGSLIITL